MVRLFVGGLPPGITCQQLQERFGAFGAVAGCEIAPPKTYQALVHDEGYHRGFGFVELEPHDEQALRKCMAAYNGSKWRGHVLRCQVAKPGYQQRLQQEREAGAGGQEQQEARRRKLLPLEPGAKLRLRHPSRPTTLEVELASGQRLTSFPPAAGGSRAGARGAAPSWEPLPMPPRARYTFEARLRAVAEQYPAPVSRLAPARVDEDEQGAGHATGGGRGAAIPLQYPPNSSPLPTAVARRPAASAARARPALQQAQQAQLALAREPAPQQRKRRVVDFIEEEDATQLAGPAAKVDLSRFGSDSEEEAGPGLAAAPAGRLAPALTPGGACAVAAPQQPRPQQKQPRQPRKQPALGAVPLDLGKFVSESDDEAGPAAGAARPSVAGQPRPRQQPVQDSGGAALPASHPRQGRPEQQRHKQQQARRASAPPPAGLSGPPGHPATVVGAVPAAQAAARPAAAVVPAQQAQQGAKRKVIDFLSPQDQQQLRKRAGVDLSRFGSDSDEEGPPPPAASARGRAIPQLDGAWDSSSSEGEDEEEESGSGNSGSASSSDEGGSGSADSSSSSSSSSSEEEDSGSSASEAEGAAGADGEPGGAAAYAVAGASSEGEEDTAGAPAAERGEREGEEPSGAVQAGPQAAYKPRQQQQQQQQQQPAAPSWMARLLPAGAAFRRQERLEQIEATWRVSREGLAQDYRAKHRQAVRHLSRPAGKKQRRK